MTQSLWINRGALRGAVGVKSDPGGGSAKADPTGQAFDRDVAVCERPQLHSKLQRESDDTEGSSFPQPSARQKIITWLRSVTGMTGRGAKRWESLRAEVGRQYGPQVADKTFRAKFDGEKISDLTGSIYLDKTTEMAVHERADNILFRSNAKTFFAAKEAKSLGSGINLKWARNFKKEHNLSGVEMTMILANLEVGSKQLENVGVIGNSKEFLTNMRDFSTTAMTAYRHVHDKEVNDGFQGPETKRFMDAYAEAMLTVKRSGPEAVSPRANLKAFLIARDEEIIVSNKAYAAAAQSGSGLELKFDPAGDIKDSEELGLALAATSSLAKAMTDELRGETPLVAQLRAPLGKETSFSDNELMRLDNAGVTVVSVREFSGRKGAVSHFSDKIYAQTHKQIASLKNASVNEKLGISNTMLVDFGRVSYRFGDNLLRTEEGGKATKTEDIILALEEFCTDEKTGEIDRNMMMAVSQVANQGLMLDGVVAANTLGSMPMYPNVRLLPSRYHENSCVLEKDPKGDFTITYNFVSRGGFVVAADETNAEPVAIDSENGGYFSNSIAVKVSKENYSKNSGLTPSPQLLAMNYEYNLVLKE